MKIAKSLFATMLCFSWFFLLPLSYAGNEYFLVDGTLAVVQGNQLILIDKSSRRSVAPAGRYETRGHLYTIVVKGNRIEIFDHTKESR